MHLIKTNTFFFFKEIPHIIKVFLIFLILICKIITINCYFIL